MNITEMNEIMELIDLNVPKPQLRNNTSNSIMIGARYSTGQFQNQEKRR